VKVALTGLAQSGKTTFFDAVTGLHALSGFSRAEANLGQIRVPDDRLDFLGKLVKPKKLTHATIDLVDIPGIARGADAVKNNPSLIAQMREAEALAIVVRAYESGNVAHPLGSIDPARDVAEVHSDFAIADLDILEKRIEKLHKGARAGLKPEEKRELELLEKLLAVAQENDSLAGLELAPDDEKHIRQFQFLTRKPMAVILNCSEEQLAGPPSVDTPLPVIPVCAEIEKEISELAEADRAAFMEELGIGESAATRLIRGFHGLMGAVTFFTTAGSETKAWTIRRGTNVLEAAAKIHSDMARGFIRAEVYNLKDLEQAGDIRSLKAAGKVSVESKDYIVQDGDVIQVRFNV